MTVSGDAASERHTVAAFLERYYALSALIVQRLNAKLHNHPVVKTWQFETRIVGGPTGLEFGELRLGLFELETGGGLGAAPRRIFISRALSVDTVASYADPLTDGANDVAEGMLAPLLAKLPTPPDPRG